MRWEWTDLVKQREREGESERGGGGMEGWREAERGFLLQCVCVEEAGSEEQSGGEDAGCSDGDSLCVTLKTLSVSWRGEKEQQHICVKVRREASHTHTHVYLRLLDLFMLFSWGNILIVGF